VVVGWLHSGHPCLSLPSVLPINTEGESTKVEHTKKRGWTDRKKEERKRPEEEERREKGRRKKTEEELPSTPPPLEPLPPLAITDN